MIGRQEKERRSKIRVLIPAPTRTLFVGTLKRKVTSVQNVGQTPKNQPGRERRKPKSRAGQGAGFLEQGDQQRLRNLADHCTWMQKVGWDRTYDLGAAISHFHWKRRWVCNRKRTVQTTKLFQENSSLTVVATEYGYGVTFRGREADAHKALISAIKVRNEGHVAVVDSQGGYIIPCSSALARKNGTHIGYTKIKKLVQTRNNQQLCSMHARHLRCFLLFGQRDCMHSCFSVLIGDFSWSHA